jgi:hypothetical protein
MVLWLVSRRAGRPEKNGIPEKISKKPQILKQNE